MSLSAKSEDYIREQSKFYGRNPKGKQITEYQKRVNEASEALCLSNPDLLADRNLLLDTARESVNASGYQFKKGRSRSKRLNSADETEGPKRKKISKEYRMSRIGELEERIKDLTDQIGFKVKRRDCASNMKNYKECDKLTEQLSALKGEKRQLEMELATLTKKEKKSLGPVVFQQKGGPGSPCK